MGADPAPAVLPALDLAGDGDELDLILGIETAFGVEFGDEDTAGWTTLGDVADWLERRFEGRPSGEKCASAMAFHRLRAAIGDRRLAPATRLAECLPGPPREALTRLSSRSGLELPRPNPARTGRLGSWLLFAAFPAFALLFAGWPVWIPVGLALAGLALLCIDRGTYPVETLGQLAEAVAALNHGPLAMSGARQDRDTIWRSLLRLAELHAGASPETVGRQTRIIA